MAKDYYEILGLNKNASKEDIKKAFYKMAHKYHPDKKGGDEIRFKEVNEACQILSNEGKRKNYDQFGSGFENIAGGYASGQTGGQYSQGGFGGFDFSNFSGGFQNGGNAGVEFDFGNLNDIFSDFFGGGMRGRSQARRGRDISTEMQITFSESIFGVARKFLMTKNSTCSICQGTGGKPGAKMETCKHCNGQGRIHETKRSLLGPISTTKTCEECMGSGQIPSEKCENCKGKGILREENEITVNVPTGIRDGEMIRMSGVGEAVSGGTSGDLYIKINVSPHSIFRREGSNLIMTMELKLSDALLGAEYPVQTLDGEIKVKIPEGVSVNEILRVKGKGVPERGKRGDLLIKLNIKMPKKLSRKSRKIIEELKEDGI